MCRKTIIQWLVLFLYFLLLVNIASHIKGSEREREINFARFSKLTTLVSWKIQFYGIEEEVTFSKMCIGFSGKLFD